MVIKVILLNPSYHIFEAHLFAKLKYLAAICVFTLLCLETKGQDIKDSISKKWGTTSPAKFRAISDSTFINKARIEKPKLELLSRNDSILNVKNRLNLSSDTSRKEPDLKSKISNYKVSIPSKDSLKSKSPVKNLDPLSKQDKSFNKYLKLDGVISNETYASNFVMPFSMSEKVYSRFYGSPTLTLYNLPFNVNFYYTTESNTVYNSNYLTVSFDRDRYLSEARANADKRISEKMQILDKNKLQELKGKGQMKLLQDSIQERKKALGKLNLAEGDLKIPGTMPLHKDSILHLRKWQDSLGQLREVSSKAKIPTLDTSGWRKKLQQTIEDSLSQMKGLKSKADRSSVDTSGWKQKVYQRFQDSLNDEDIAKYERNKHKRDSIAREIKRLEDNYQKVDSAISNLRKADSLLNRELETLKDLRNKNPLGTVASKLPPKISRPLGKVVTNLEKFNIGLTTPEFSSYSLSGVPVKGINTRFTVGQNYVELVAGNTRDFQFSRLGAGFKAPKFDNPLHGLKIGRKSDKGEYYLTTIYAKRPSEAFSNRKNLINALGGNWKLSENVGLQGEFLTSYYSRKINTPEVPVTFEQGPMRPILPRQLFWQSSSYWLQSKAKLTRSTELTAKISQVNLGYSAFGAPFLRKNFKEFDIKIGQQLFKRKLALTASYKELSNNQSVGDSVKNQTRGYGFTLKTAFKKYPNLFASYTPYFQGNNHPDTLFRTNNQFSLLTVMVYHNFKIKKAMINASVNYAHSKTEFFRINNSIHETQLIGGNISGQFAKLNVQLGYQNSRTFPKIDSVSYDAYQVDMDYTLSKGVTVGLQGQGNIYLNGSYLANGGIHARINIFAGLSLQAVFNYGKLDGLYGLNEKEIFSGKLYTLYTIGSFKNNRSKKALERKLSENPIETK